MSMDIKMLLCLICLCCTCHISALHSTFFFADQQAPPLFLPSVFLHRFVASSKCPLDTFGHFAIYCDEKTDGTTMSLLLAWLFVFLLTDSLDLILCGLFTAGGGWSLVAWTENMTACGLLTASCGEWVPLVRNGSAQMNAASFWRTIGGRGIPFYPQRSNRKWDNNWVFST